jgi:hypothetical protein
MMSIRDNWRKKRGDGFTSKESPEFLPDSRMITSPQYESKKALTESERHLNLFFSGCTQGTVLNPAYRTGRRSLPLGENDL